MKKFCLLCLLVLASLNLRAQADQTPCNDQFSVKLIPCDPALSNQSKFATLQWDFSKVKFSRTQVKIEVMPMAYCVDGLSGTQFRELRTVSITKDKAKGTQNFGLNEMWAKCFKWRTVVTGPDCESISEWNFYSFL